MSAYLFSELPLAKLSRLSLRPSFKPYVVLAENRAQQNLNLRIVHTVAVLTFFVNLRRSNH